MLLQWNGVTCSLSDWPVGVDDCAEKLDCDALGWPADLHGSSAVCGSSSLVGEFGSSDLCVREKTYHEAESLCTEVGGRLCTAFELQSNEGDPEACDYNSIFKWSWVDTPPDACPSANQSLGMPGSGGSWFSFVPTSLNAYEIQLHSERALDGDSFVILGVLDAHGETVAGQAATPHHREDGAMLRWNATRIGEAAFVHVSAAADATYTMAVVLPPEYSWHSAPAQSAGHVGVAVSVLNLQRNGAVAVNLPFGFPFFGLEHRRVWISSFGMVLFEEPREVGAPFGGTDGTHNAIMAAAGEFDLSRADASVTTSRLSATELRVSWHAPLFNSEAFSDVSVVLAEEGNVTIEWSQVDLSGGGSLGHGLALLLGGFNVLDSGQATVALNSGQAQLVTRDNDAQGTGVSVSTLTMGASGGIHAGAAPAATACETTLGAGLGPYTNLGDTVGELRSCTGMVVVPRPNQLLVFGCIRHEVVQCGYNSVEHPGDYDRALAAFAECVTAAGPAGSWPHCILGLETAESLSSQDACPGGDSNGGGVGIGFHTIIPFAVRCYGVYQFRFHTDDGRGVFIGINDDVRRNHRTENIWGYVYMNDLLFHAGTYTFEALGFEDCCDGFSSMDVRLPNSDDWIRATSGTPSALAGICDSDSEGHSRGEPRRCLESDALPDSWLELIDDANIELAPMTLGDSIAVSAWVRAGHLWDSEIVERETTSRAYCPGPDCPWISTPGGGTTLFNSFESSTCGDSDACRNSVNGVLDRSGWFAIGVDVSESRPADLWMPNTIFNQETAALFWADARVGWMHVTVSVDGTQARVYAAGELRGVGLLTSRLPRMLRHNNYIGASSTAPYSPKSTGTSIAVADFRLFDRGLSSSEISALFADPASECCIGAGLKDAYGVHDLDLSLEAMRSGQPSALAITPSEQDAGSDAGSDAQRGCVSDTAAATQQLDICGEITKVSECRGEIRDGTGPYA
eukprot:COSAG06_NODE_786_length_12305_cov_9.158774_4_plen_967_part_01